MTLWYGHRTTKFGKDLQDHRVRSSTQSTNSHHLLMPRSVMSTLFLNTYRAEESTTSQGSLSQYLTAVSEKNFFLISNLQGISADLPVSPVQRRSMCCLSYFSSAPFPKWLLEPTASHQVLMLSLLGRGAQRAATHRQLPDVMASCQNPQIFLASFCTSCFLWQHPVQHPQQASVLRQM